MFIEIKNLKKEYGKGDNKVYALNDTSLEIEKGEVVAILGPSGSGKSTLMNIVGGIDKATSGNVKVGNNIINNMSENQLSEYRRKSIGFIFQSYNLVADLTAKENIQLITDVVPESISVDELMQELGMTKYAKHFPKELSGGQQQRIAIARAMVKKPEILLCDEPTAALDSKTSKEVLSLIEKMNKKYKITTIIVTHNELISQVADRIIKLKDGVIIQNKLNENKLPVSELEM